MAAKKDLRIYPALFHFEEEDKLFCVEYPDLPGCVTVGENMEIALRRAKEALEGFLFSSEQNGYPVAPPTPLEKMSVPAEHILVPFRFVWTFYAKRWPTEALRKTSPFQHGSTKWPWSIRSISPAPSKRRSETG